MLKFDIGANRLCAAGTKAVAEALKDNQTMTELNISDNCMDWKDWESEAPDMSGVIAISDAIPTMGALAKLTFGGDGTYRPYEPVTLEVGMAEANLSNKNLGAGGAIIVGAWISHKDNGALTSLNISSNSLGGHYERRGRRREWISDMSGVKALAAAIPECK